MTDLVSIHSDPNSEDPLKAMEILLSYPLVNFTSQYFRRTREYDMGLQFVDRCQQIISANKASISYEKIEEWKQYLITLKLTLLDFSNDWEAYIDIYKKDLTKPVHSTIAKRYEIICRKLERKKAGKSVEHLKRHQKESLTLSEQERRYAEMMALFLRIVR